MMNIILFGAPGAGKGTQASLLKERYDLQHFSTGEMLRSEIAAGSALGKSIENVINRGIYVSDELIMQMIASKIKENMTAKGFIFDGIPRTIEQAQMLDEVLIENNISICAAILLDVDEDELTKRMISRAKILGRTDDSSEEVIRRRIRTYHEKTEPIFSYYKAQEKFFVVSGMGSVDDTIEKICGIINEKRFNITAL